MAEYAIGLDLGASKIEGALIDRDGSLLDLIRRPTHPEEGLPSVMTRIIACVDELIDQVDENLIAGVGVGSPGVVNHERGVVVNSLSMDWHNVPLRHVIAGFLGLDWEPRIWVDNDSNVAVLGEMYYGAGQGVQNLLYVAIGTHVGSGMILNGKIYRGASGGAGELGHIVIDPGGQLCNCGRRGCLETLISGPAIARQARALLKQGVPSSLNQVEPEAITSIEVISAARTGDWLARSVLENTGVYLGMVLAYYISLNNPEIVLVGGGVGAAGGDLLLAAARQVIEARAVQSNIEAARLVPPALGGSSGAVGAAALVWYELNNESMNA